VVFVEPSCLQALILKHHHQHVHIVITQPKYRFVRIKQACVQEASFLVEIFLGEAYVLRQLHQVVGAVNTAKHHALALMLQPCRC
jgi:hypothetical protein